ncbi:DUF2726 domain-containing protein [Leptothrix discophora]|uniref:DUF2726 domain-containing protein n=1 Tax=Leptothrix discophora TaxID=89 RepID=A0ABT9G7D0_LEPDI|nr:DUF2726 domain-containing protein [Leptothrix discophora]MDP4302306.1 DUF2726 domain-containing protein [Leptothrix discophora]
MDLSMLAANPIALVVLSGVCAAVVVWFWRRSHGSKPRQASIGRPRALDAVDTVIGWPPEATRVLTLRHQRAFEVLRRALPDHLVLAQVPISHFVRVPTRNSYVEWMRRVGHVCVDLMVCDAASNVIAVIEVRPADRVETERARKRHLRVERVLRAGGIPLHVWTESLLPDPAAVRKIFVPQAAAEVLSDEGPETSPMEPTLHGQGRPRPGRSSDIGGDREPPRTTWFDDLNATRPAQLDPVDAAAHDLPENSSLGGIKPPAHGIVGLSR